MSSITPGSLQQLGYCEALLVGIEQINGCNNSTFKSTPIGVTQALLDESNTADARYEIHDGPSVRSIRVKRIPRSSYTDAEDQVSCDVTTTTQIKEQIIEVCESANISFEVENADMERFCREAWNLVNTGGQQGDLSFMQQHLQFINANMNGIRERINRKVIAKILANVGVNITSGNNLATQLDMLDSTTGAKIEKGIQNLMYDMRNNEVYCQPLIAGFGNFERFNTSANYGCCNSSGLSWDSVMAGAPYKYYQDVNLGGLTGNDNYFLALAPGATQFVYHNNRGLGRTSIDQRHGDTVYGLIPDPMLPGVWYNIAVQEKNCFEGMRKPSWTFSMYIYFDVAFLPDNAFSADDRLRTPGGISNGVYLFESLAI